MAKASLYQIIREKGGCGSLDIWNDFERFLLVKPERNEIITSIRTPKPYHFLQPF